MFQYLTDASDPKVKVTLCCKQDDLYQQVNERFANDDSTINFVHV